MSAAEEGYYQDRIHGVTVSIKPICSDAEEAHKNQKVLKDAKGLAVVLENNGSAAEVTRSRIREAAKASKIVATHDTKSRTYVFGSSKAVTEFLVGETPLLDASWKQELEEMFRARSGTRRR